MNLDPNHLGTIWSKDYLDYNNHLLIQQILFKSFKTLDFLPFLLFYIHHFLFFPTGVYYLFMRLKYSIYTPNTYYYKSN